MDESIKVFYLWSHLVKNFISVGSAEVFNDRVIGALLSGIV
jgi:hypothetical protein